MACMFSLLVGGECGPDPRSNNQSFQVVPLVSSNKNITCHKKLSNFSGCDTEIELMLARSACFRTPVNIQEMTICPLHRECLGIGWRRSVRQCSVPWSYRDMMAQQSKRRSEAARCSSRSLYYKPKKNSFHLAQVNKCFMC